MKFIKTFLISLVVFLSIATYMFFISSEGVPSILADSTPFEDSDVSEVDENADKEDQLMAADDNIITWRHGKIYKV